MLCLLADGYQNRSTSAITRDEVASLKLVEDPPSTTATYLQQQANLSMRFDAAAGANNCSTCGQHYESFTGNQQVSGSYCTGPSGNDTHIDGELGINTLDHNFYEFAIEPPWVRKEWPDVLVRVSFVAPVVLLGIIGNLTIIWSICKFKSFRSKPTNIFILSMAIADLITALVCPLAALFTDIYQFYVLGSALCRLEGSIKITCLLVSAYSLNWLSFIWLRYIVQPCRNRISIKQSWIILAGIWVASILMASPLFYWRMLRSRQWRDLNEIWCCELIHISKYYWVVITFIIVYLPTFFMTIILVIILIQMDKFEAKLRRSRTNQSSNSLTINMKYRRRIVKVLILYLGISIVCWAPFQFSIIYRHFRKEACLPPGYSDFVFASQLLASVPGALNPFVFGFLSQPFRKIVSTFWMFKFLDKLLIWRDRPNSEQNQMEIKIVDRKNQKQQKVIVATNNQQQTTAMTRSSASKSGKLNRAVANANHLGHVQSGSSRMQADQVIDRSGPRRAPQQGGGTKNKSSAGASNQDHQVIRGCENAAYESTVGDEPAPTKLLEIADPERQPREDVLGIGTTSFIHYHRQLNHRRHRQILQLERPMSPTSIVSMDSINIEENLGPSSPDDTNVYLQQQQPAAAAAAMASPDKTG